MRSTGGCPHPPAAGPPDWVPLPAEDATARPGWLARDLGYLLLGLPLGIAAFVVSVAGFAAGVGTLVI